MAEERVYIIPLRKEWLKASRPRRAKKAVNAARQFLAKHMKSDNVKLGKYLNEAIWERGIKYPPHHVKVKVIKDDAGKVMAELFDAPVEKKETVEKKVKQAEAAKEQKEEKEKPEAKPAEKPAAKKPEAPEPKKQEKPQPEKKASKPSRKKAKTKTASK